VAAAGPAVVAVAGIAAAGTAVWLADSDFDSQVHHPAAWWLPVTDGSWCPGLFAPGLVLPV
jgi:hypothetical protein